MTVTPAQLAALAPRCDAAVLAPALAAAAEERLIDTPLRLSHFLGQLVVESAGLTQFEENLIYSAERLHAVWPSRFPTVAAAEPFAHNPQALANKVYGGRMGNTGPDDGWRYRARGLIQITGHENYERFGKVLGLDFLGTPGLAAEPVTAAWVAAAYWSDHGLNASADADDIDAITRAINGGVNGLAERKAAVAKAKSVLGA